MIPCTYGQISDVKKNNRPTIYACKCISIEAQIQNVVSRLCFRVLTTSMVQAIQQSVDVLHMQLAESASDSRAYPNNCNFVSITIAEASRR